MIPDPDEFATDFALQTKTFIPGNTVSSGTGRPDIPVFSLNERQNQWGVVLHPLWDAGRLFEMLGLDRSYVAIDSFELSRNKLTGLASEIAAIACCRSITMRLPAASSGLDAFHFFCGDICGVGNLRVA